MPDAHADAGPEHSDHAEAENPNGSEDTAGPTAGDDAEAEATLPFDVQLVQATFKVIAPQGEELVETFYERLLAQHPGVLPLFERVAMEQQRAKLLSALATVVASLTDVETLVPHLQRLGERHVGHGALPAHYEAVGAVLLESIADVAGDAWSTKAEQAWAQAYGVAPGVMIEAGEALRARQESKAAA